MLANSVFKVCYSLIVRFGDYRAACLYALLAQDHDDQRPPATVQQLTTRLNASRSQIGTSVEHLLDWGVVLPSDGRTAPGMAILALEHTARFRFWAVERFSEDFPRLRKELQDLHGVPLEQLTYGGYQIGEVPPQIDYAFTQLLHQLHIITTTTTTTTNRAPSFSNDENLHVEVVAAEEVKPVLAKTVSKKKRVNSAPFRSKIEKSFQARFVPLANLELIEPNIFARVWEVVNHFNTTFQAKVKQNTYVYAEIRELIVEQGYDPEELMAAITAASRDTFWRKTGNLRAILKPGRIEQLAQGKHDRYARGVTETETREF